jgi:L-glutamine-phosphate cytidylyltransferase
MSDGTGAGPPADPAGRAIIVAAGRGSRLGDKTDTIPKTMVPVAGRPILHHQLEALSQAGVQDFVVVRGYNGHLIEGGRHRLRFVENPEWQTNNILASLLYAEAEMEPGFVFSYSDIVYAAEVARRLVHAARQAARTADAAAALVIDRRWQDAYVGRTLHPVSEAELAQVQGSGAAARVVRVGKQAVDQGSAIGEFIGLAWFSPLGARALRELWKERVAAPGLDAPFGRARALRVAYLTDALNALAEAGHRLAPVFIDGSWREIDTGQDLAAAETVVGGWG